MRAALGARVPDLESINRTARAHAVWLAQNFAAVEAWRTTLDSHVREQMNHPSVIRRRYDAAHGVTPSPGTVQGGLELFDASKASAAKLIAAFGDEAAWRFANIVEQLLEERSAAADATVELSEDQLAGLATEHWLEIAEPEPFAVPEAGEIAHGRVDAEYVTHAFIWPAAERPGFHHILTLLNYPPAEVASNGISCTAKCQKRPIGLNDYALENMLYGILEFDHKTAEWEIVEAEPSVLEDIRQWIMTGTRPGWSAALV